MKNNIEEGVKYLIESFEELEVYKLFLNTKKAIENSKELSELMDTIKLEKGKIKDLKNDHIRLSEQILKVKELEAKYDNHPLIVNYNLYKEELKEVTKPLVDMLSNE